MYVIIEARLEKRPTTIFCCFGVRLVIRKRIRGCWLGPDERMFQMPSSKVIFLLISGFLPSPVRRKRLRSLSPPPHIDMPQLPRISDKTGEEPLVYFLGKPSLPPPCHTHCCVKRKAKSPKIIACQPPPIKTGQTLSTHPHPRRRCIVTYMYWDPQLT